MKLMEKNLIMKEIKILSINNKINDNKIKNNKNNNNLMKKNNKSKLKKKNNLQSEISMLGIKIMVKLK